uniref:Uncharacterized protein n=1 Tax=Salix viminalis TaxID=40686 RepID=A0A6N2KNF9_SALVM
MTEVSTTGPSKSSWTCASGFKASYRVVPVELLEPHLNPIDGTLKDFHFPCEQRPKQEEGDPRGCPVTKQTAAGLGSTDKVLYPHDVVWTRNLPSMSSLNEAFRRG